MNKNYDLHENPAIDFAIINEALQVSGCYLNYERDSNRVYFNTDLKHQEVIFNIRLVGFEPCYILEDIIAKLSSSKIETFSYIAKSNFNESGLILLHALLEVALTRISNLHMERKANNIMITKKSVKTGSASETFLYALLTQENLKDFINSSPQPKKMRKFILNSEYMDLKDTTYMHYILTCMGYEGSIEDFKENKEVLSFILDK